MPKRKTVEVADPAHAVAQPAKKIAAKPKAATGKAAHKHHAKSEPVPEALANVPPAVTPEAIARLAYSYWEARGRQDGFAEQDWLQAERELSKLA
jgi:hypothetical protein